MNLSKLWEIVRDSKPGVLQSMGLQRVGHNWATEPQQQRNWCERKNKQQKKKKKKANTQNQKLRGLKTIEIYFLTVLETRSLKLQCLWGASFWRFWGRSWFKTLPASVGANPLCSLVIAAEIQGLRLSSRVSLCVRPLSFLRTQVSGFKAHPKSRMISAWDT